MSWKERQIHLSPRLLKQVLTPEPSPKLTSRRWNRRGWVWLLAALLLTAVALAWQHGEFLSAWLKRLFYPLA